ncbi:hypothetical protein [Tumebacillus permanentifrigoris]|jgi:hypothetical protein|uniref:Uncharacterized protein n=1 Tax=Tumebacillus permanentifrigoris TaxID=378543 RepID=A0A316D539_9BACL|nr:hypothetical protein [Tumebacillus permanentifrigoris]PWK08426.1 hypothetical protein C7459_11578 [Tumebacillus permanentifrigoris]
MASILVSAIAILGAFLVFIYAYSFLQFMLTITKCPDCGRIMQRVIYTELADEKKKQVVTECRFCTAKRIRKVSEIPLRRKDTLYP